MNTLSSLKLVVRVKPNYLRDVFVDTFSSETEFKIWENKTLKSHATFNVNQKTKNAYNEKVLYYRCDHSFNPRVVKDENLPNSRKRPNSKKSIKTNCKAYCKVTYNSNGTVFVEYHWQHSNHDPCDIEDISSSRLYGEIREWVRKHVENHLDWKGVKSLLRMTDEELSAMEKMRNNGIVPYNLLVNHKLVNNIINDKFNAASRKHAQDLISVKLWMEHLQKKDYETFFIAKPYNGPFLISFVSSWQRKFLEEAREWCVDSTHKTCKSAVDPSRDAFLFTIVVKNPITLKVSLYVFVSLIKKSQIFLLNGYLG